MTIALKHDWSKWQKWLDDSDQSKADSALSLQELFYTHAVQRHMIQFHSSLIDYRGHGLMFLGPSGIGKTTQAELWNQYRERPHHQRRYRLCAGDQRKPSSAGEPRGTALPHTARTPAYR